tara:strand:- start:952 stop:1896 length:945 start_codon:yes stop_codon:yes gene_type:complete
MSIESYVKQARFAYYNGHPIIPDEMYDALVERANILETIGSEGDDRFPHLFPMYSLQKVYAGDNNAPDYKRNNVIVTPKLDGAAVALTYVRGKLEQALTRGDGKEGNDITSKMKSLLQFDLPSETDQIVFQITGELVAPSSIPNARNYAAGALNLNSLSEFEQREVYFVAYGVQPYPTDSFAEDLATLREWGFETALCSSYTEFPKDGSVFRVDSNKYFEELGHTSHHPRGAFALKDKPTGVVTKLLDVVWQVGKSGAVSPVAILEPVMIGEATVSRASLHNMAIIEGLGLEIGCHVEVIRAGEIIPQIISRVD